MKQDIQHIMLAAAKPLFLIFILYILKTLEVGMAWDFSHLGVYPMERRGVAGILTHPLVHSGFSHLLANTIPLFFLSWCLFYFYRGIAGKIFILIWLGSGLLTFLIGKPGWHIGASGLIYGLAFFLFFSGILRKYVPLVAISLLVTFLYGGIIWNMFPYFSPANMSWEGHLSGGITGTLCAFAFMKHGPQRPEPFADEEETEEKEIEEGKNNEETNGKNPQTTEEIEEGKNNGETKGKNSQTTEEIKKGKNKGETNGKNSQTTEEIEKGKNNRETNGKNSQTTEETEKGRNNGETNGKNSQAKEETEKPKYL